MPPASPPPAHTRDRLIECAEELFADRGFEAVSVRDITRAAGANVAAINYHFGSRDGLIDAILERLIVPIDTARVAHLDALEGRHPGGVPLRGVVEAFILPLTEHLGGSERSQQLFFKLLGRCLGQGIGLPENVRPVVDEAVARFSRALCRALPEVPEDLALWRLHFSMGALIHTLGHSETLQKIAPGRIGNPQPEEVLAHLVEYCTAGLSGARALPTLQPGVSMPRSTVLLAPCALLLGASCASLSPEGRHADAGLRVPGSWAATEEARAGIDASWVRHFDDPRLGALISEALAANPDLLAAAARLEAAAQNPRLAGVAARPTAELGFTPRRARSNFVGFPFGEGGDAIPTTTTNSFELQFAASWELDIWGRVRAAAMAATAQFEASAAEYQAARTSLSARVAKAYFALLEARAQVALARESLRIYGDTEEAVRSRFESGDDRAGTGSQLRLASSDVATARASLATQQDLEEQASRQLELLLGRHPAAALRGAGDLPAPPPRPPAGLPSELLLRRPDLVAAERRFAATGEAAEEASRARFPRLALTGSAGTSTDDLDEIFNSDFGVWSLAGNIAQPILTGGRLRAELEKRKASDTAALRDLQGAVLKAFGEVEGALGAGRHLAAREAALRDAAALAAEAGEEARAEYARGVGDILTALAAQTRELAARSALLQVRRARLDNRADLHLALGGDFEVHL